jgi:type IV secretory pathway TraG/TraD family ATPase VirD4
VDAKKFLDFFIEDVKDWIGKRQPRGTKGLLIIDEFGTFRNQNITDVLSLARSSNLGVILATQDTATLGDTNTARRILANCNTYLLMKTNFPEELTELAGTVYRIEASQQTAEGGQATGVGSARVQHQYKINPNEVPKMAPGEAFLINSRFTAKIQMKQVPQIEINEQAIAPGLESRKTNTAADDLDVGPTKPDLDIE